jgi:hypothetical protein
LWRSKISTTGKRRKREKKLIATKKRQKAILFTEKERHRGNKSKPKTKKTLYSPLPRQKRKQTNSFLTKYATKRIGLLPMASPLFSGFIPATWFLKLDSVSPDQGHSQSEEGRKLSTNQKC